MAESSGVKRKTKLKKGGTVRAPTGPRQARTRIRQLPEGHDIMDSIVRGEPIADIEQRTGLSRRALFARVTTFETLAPDAFRRLADSMRTFLSGLAVEDILYWRPLIRHSTDLETQKLGLAGYKHATDTIIKVFGLQTQGVEISANIRQTPHTMEEIAAHIRENPEMAAAVERLHQLTEAKPAA